MVERGLADDFGQAHWRLHDRLETIARRGQSLELRVFGADATRAMLATRGRRNVLAVLGDRFQVRSVPATGRTETLLTLLPDVPAGQGYSVTVDTAVFADATKTSNPFDRLRRHGMSTDDARTLLAMATHSVRIAQIVAETRGADGRGVRSRAVSVHDTPTGRYQTIRTITANADHLTVTPATAASIAGALSAVTAR